MGVSLINSQDEVKQMEQENPVHTESIVDEDEPP